MEVKIHADQAELEDRVADRLHRQLKGVTPIVEQQTRHLREEIEVLSAIWKPHGETLKHSWQSWSPTGSGNGSGKGGHGQDA
jgi:hypothetical protein